jgi:metal-responsive CopG/Arc/MetJ family transcriptional regulator
MRTQVIIELDQNMSAELDRVAPSRDRRRSEFIRAAGRSRDP